MIGFICVLPYRLVAEQLEYDCAGAHNWATQITFVHMKNVKLISSFPDTDDTKTTLIEQKEIGAYPESDNITIFRSVQQIDMFHAKDNKTFKIITISDVSNVECSMSSVTTIMIYPEIRVLNIAPSYIEDKIINNYKFNKIFNK
jgi:hypothetical protein